jgi:hypothetical protein
LAKDLFSLGRLSAIAMAHRSVIDRKRHTAFLSLAAALCELRSRVKSASDD